MCRALLTSEPVIWDFCSIAVCTDFHSLNYNKQKPPEQVVLLLFTHL